MLQSNLSLKTYHNLLQSTWCTTHLISHMFLSTAVLNIKIITVTTIIILRRDYEKLKHTNALMKVRYFYQMEKCNLKQYSPAQAPLDSAS